MEQVKFNLVKTTTWGVVKNDKGGYTIPIAINDQKVQKMISDLAEKYNAKNPLYGYGKSKRLYIKSLCLNTEQKNDLLDKDRQNIKVSFFTKCIYTWDGVNYIIFKINKLGLAGKPEA